MGEDSPLGNAGGSGGVNNTGGVLRGYRIDSFLVVIIGHIPAQSQKFFETEDPVIALGFAVEQNHFANVGDAVFYLVELGQLDIVFGKDHDTVGMVDDVLAILGQVGLVDTHRGCADTGNSQVAQDPPVTAVADNVDLFALGNPEGHQAFGNAFDLVVENAPANCFAHAGLHEPFVSRYVEMVIHCLPEHVIDVAIIGKLHAFPFPQ